MKNSIKDSYENGECPDCGDDIPVEVMEGEECKNCGHAFFAEVEGLDEGAENNQDISQNPA